MSHNSRRALGPLGLGALLAAALAAHGAQASEGGASIYLLGSGGPETAIMPPLKGIFLQNTFYDYDGSASAERNFEIGGRVVAGIHASIPADFPILAWVPTTNLAGGTLSLSATVPFGGPSVDVDAELTGPGGRTIAVNRHDSTFVIGDPLLLADLGWKSGNLNWQLATFVNIPVGDYRQGALANLAFHRWAGDTSLAATWHDAKAGWDVSGKFGFTFNGTNDVTHYTTGTEYHLEGSIEKAVSKKISLGAQAYYFQQLSADSGSGDKIGPFKGRVIGVGGEAAYNFMIGKAPVTVRLHGFSEFDTRNRLQGRAILVDLVMPLWVKLPKAPRE
jgi:hypothetical protein